MSIDLEGLRAANIARQIEWTGSDRADIAFRALEVADEAGEVAGAVKKLLRAQRGICGSTMTLDDVADEIGDTVIAIDLLAIALGLDCPRQSPDPTYVEYWTKHPPEEITLGIDRVVGDLSGGVLRHKGNLTAFPDSDPLVEDIGINMGAALALLECLAAALGIDAGRAVAAKFDKTSAKYGLTTTMGA